MSTDLHVRIPTLVDLFQSFAQNFKIDAVNWFLNQLIISIFLFMTKKLQKQKNKTILYKVIILLNWYTLLIDLGLKKSLYK